MHLLQVVPGLPPRFDGIGDYALRMAAYLRDEHGIETRFLVCNPDWRSETSDGYVEGFAAAAIAGSTPEQFLEAVASAERETGSTTIALLIHFSPYSYQARGVPFWLVDALERRHAARPGSVHVAVHELEDHSSKPWKSSFWLAGTQRSLIRRVARIANFRYTNSELSRQRLEDWGSGRFDLILNFSTMAEPVVCRSFGEREPVVVVFGRGAQRKLTYERASPALAAVCRSLQATRIIDIGERLAGHDVADIEGFPIERTGTLPEHKVLERLSTARASFIHYPVAMLTKSSVYAVSASTGAMPYVFEHGKVERSCPGLITGQDFIPVPHSLALAKPTNPAISQRLFESYQTRSSHVAATRVAHGLRTVDLKVSERPPAR